MLLTFVGQVTAASALSCKMDMHENVSKMAHSSHMMSEQPNNMSDHSSNCCAENDGCTMSGCFSIALPTLMPYSNISLSSNAVESQMSFIVTQYHTSLYRPPILG